MKKKSRPKSANLTQEKYIRIRRKMQAETHIRDVYDFMYKNGSITSFQAFSHLHDTRLSATVFKLRYDYGVPVVTTMVEKNGKRFGKYWIDWEACNV